MAINSIIAIFLILLKRSKGTVFFRHTQTIPNFLAVLLRTFQLFYSEVFDNFTPKFLGLFRIFDFVKTQQRC